MGFEGSYLWSLRQVVGNQLLLSPGAQVLLIDQHGLIYLQRRKDMGIWEIPAGACEMGSSFASTAVTEVFEETGLTIAASDLVAFACLSDPAIHIVEYPNGDRTHGFAVCFEARGWSGSVEIDPAEVTEYGFFSLDELPSPLHPPTQVALDLYRRFRATGAFQVS